MYFVDTAFVHALINARDQWHALALNWQQRLTPARPRYVTTEYVLWEIADGLAAVRFRLQAAKSVRAFLANPHVEVVLASAELLDAALTLFQNRSDKEWSLTDCASFIVMTERGLTDALTSDEHFRQAGFRPLLLEEPPAAGP
jgi:predicted nucleic acid-binding protein